MLGTLRKVFIEEANQSDPSASEQTNPSFIVEPEKIIKLLQQVIESPPLCTVSLPNCNTTFFTSILEVQQEKSLVLFDRLTPQSGNHLLSQLGALKISTYINGVHLSFQLKGVIQDHSINPVVYKAHLPDSIYYPQRRSSPRIEIDINAINFQGTSRDTGLLIKGYVLDISRTGLCVDISKIGNNILSGDKLSNCLIQLPDKNTLEFDLSLRSIRKSMFNSSQRQIGGFFNGLSMQKQNKLDRTICALERQQIRKRKK
jgi:c-di-GMP-binding flagellar brake protein YcgR